MRYWVNNKEITEQEKDDIVENNKRILYEDVEKWKDIKLIIVTDDNGKMYCTSNSNGGEIRK